MRPSGWIWRGWRGRTIERGQPIKIAVSFYCKCSEILPQICLPSGAGAPFGFHQISQNIVNAGEMTLALGAQPIEHPGIETDAYRNLAPGRAQADKMR